jgi:hypothetical protein
MNAEETIAPLTLLERALSVTGPRAAPFFGFPRGRDLRETLPNSASSGPG